jgi:hypothetical protein
MEETQLVILQSQSDTGVIDCDLNASLTLPRNAQVAVHSLACTVDQYEIDIGSANNTIQYSFTTRPGVISTAVIASGTYSVSNINQMYSAITAALNTGMNPEPTSVGMECKAGQSGGKSTITFTQSPQVDPYTTSSYVSQNVNRAANGTYSRNGGSSPAGDSWLGQNAPLGQGYANMFFRINSLPVGANIVFGLTAVNPSTASTAYAISNIVCGVQLVAGSDISYILDGQAFLTTNSVQSATVGSALNDMFEIVRLHNQFAVNQHVSGAVDPVTLCTQNVQQGAVLYPICIFFGTTGGVTFLRTTVSPFLTSSTTFNVRTDSSGNTFDPGFQSRPASQNANWQNAVLQFTGEDLATWLGYETVRYGPVASFNQTVTFSAENDPDALPNSIIVASDSFRLKSYRAGIVQSGSGAVNVLDVIPYNGESSELTYISQRFFLSLDNAAPLSLTRLRFRLLRSDFSALDTDGVITLVLLFKSAKNNLT